MIPSYIFTNLINVVQNFLIARRLGENSLMSFKWLSAKYTAKCSVFEIRKILILLTKSNDSQDGRGREGTIVINLNQEPNSLPLPLTHKQPAIYI